MDSKFKLGDRVYIAKLPDGRYRGAIKIGERGIVKMIYPSSVAVLIDGYRNCGSKHGYCYFPFDYLELCNDKNNSERVLIGDITNGYSFVEPEKAEELRIIKEKETEEIRLLKKLFNSTYGVSGILPRMSNRVAYPSEIEKVIFNNPATIVMWSDGTKTVVKCSEDECFDEEKGLAMAISKKVLGNKGAYYNEFKKWLPTIEEYGDRISMEEMTESFRKFGKALRKFKGDKKI